MLGVFAAFVSEFLAVEEEKKIKVNRLENYGQFAYNRKRIENGMTKNDNIKNDNIV